MKRPDPESVETLAEVKRMLLFIYLVRNRADLTGVEIRVSLRNVYRRTGVVSLKRDRRWNGRKTKGQSKSFQKEETLFQSETGIHFPSLR